MWSSYGLPVIQRSKKPPVKSQLALTTSRMATTMPMSFNLCLMAANYTPGRDASQ